MPKAKTKQSEMSREKSSSPADVVVNKKMVAAWKQENAIYEAARGDESKGWDLRYESLGRILGSDPPLYLAGGFKTAREFLAVSEPGRSERTVRSYVRVARHFDPEHEARFGVVKLEALLDILEAQSGARLPDAKIDPARQLVAVPEGKATKKIRFGDATLEQLRRGLRVVRGQSTKHSPTESPEVRALRVALGKAGAKAVGVRVASGRLDLTGIPLERVSAVGKVLAGWRRKATGKAR